MNRATRTIHAVVTAVLALAVAGCGSSQSPAGSGPARSASTSPSTTPATAQLTASLSATDQIYLDAAAERFPHAKPETLLKSRDVTCQAFVDDPAAATWVVLIKGMTDGGLSAEDAGYLVGIQVRTGCPDSAQYLP